MDVVISSTPVDRIIVNTCRNYAEGFNISIKCIISAAAIKNINTSTTKNLIVTIQALNRVVAAITIDQVIVANAGRTGVAVVVVNHVTFRIASVADVNQIATSRTLNNVVGHSRDKDVFNFGEVDRNRLSK